MPSTIVRYLLELKKQRLSLATINSTVATIRWFHLQAGIAEDLLPTREESVQEVLDDIRAYFADLRRRNEDDPQLARPLPLNELAIILAHLSRSDKLIAKRDRALFSTGWWCGYQRSELVSIRYEDIKLQSGALEISANGTKVTLCQMDDPILDPVRAILGWYAASGIHGGPIFRAIDRHGNMAPRGVGGRVINQRLELQAHEAGIDPVRLSAHSLRLGFAMEIARTGKPAYVHMDFDRLINLQRTGIARLASEAGRLGPGTEVLEPETSDATPTTTESDPLPRKSQMDAETLEIAELLKRGFDLQTATDALRCKRLLNNDGNHGTNGTNGTNGSSNDANGTNNACIDPKPTIQQSLPLATSRKKSVTGIVESIIAPEDLQTAPRGTSWVLPLTPILSAPGRGQTRGRLRTPAEARSAVSNVLAKYNMRKQCQISCQGQHIIVTKV